MFTNKKDPLVDSVKTVMAENAKRRHAESLVNEAFGVTSKRALAHEDHANYDAALNEATESVLAGELDESVLKKLAVSMGKKREKFVAAQNKPGKDADQHAKRISHVKSLVKEEATSAQIRESFNRFLRNRSLKD